ncbi:MAG: hypothetical protein J0H32_16510, partial [Rhizobiales bacterium]|nr:hypothetical protein [Hyphomicrobiales bacterium]
HRQGDVTAARRKRYVGTNGRVCPGRFVIVTAAEMLSSARKRDRGFQVLTSLSGVMRGPDPRIHPPKK